MLGLVRTDLRDRWVRACPSVRDRASFVSIFFPASGSFCLRVGTCGLSSCRVKVFRQPVTYRLLNVTTEGGPGEGRSPSVSRGEKRENDTTKLTLGLQTMQFTRECGWQDRHTVEGCI